MKEMAETATADGAALARVLAAGTNVARCILILQRHMRQTYAAVMSH